MSRHYGLRRCREVQRRLSFRGAGRCCGGVTEQVLHRTKRAILRPSKGAPALGRGSRGTASPLQSTRQSLVRNAVPARRGTPKTKGDQVWSPYIFMWTNKNAAPKKSLSPAQTGNSERSERFSVFLTPGRGAPFGRLLSVVGRLYGLRRCREVRLSSFL